MRIQGTKRWIDYSVGTSRLCGMNVGKYPEHHFLHLPDYELESTEPLIMHTCGFDVMCRGVVRLRENSNVCSFEFVEEGEIAYDFNGRHYDCQAGDLFVIHLGSHNRLECVSDYARVSNVGLGGTLLVSLLEQFRLSDVGYVRLPSSERLRSYLAEAVELFGRYEPEGSARVNALAYEILAYLSQNQKRDKSSLPPLLEKIITYLQGHLETAMDMPSLAGHFQISQGTLFGLFRKHLHTTPNDYVIGEKLRHAQRLLRDTDYAVKDIAFRCGYSNQMYFAQVFRRHFGITATAYRQGTPCKETSSEDEAPCFY